jgi:methyl-accepting chemotaxis protein
MAQNLQQGAASPAISWLRNDEWSYLAGLISQISSSSEEKSQKWKEVSLRTQRQWEKIKEKWEPLFSESKTFLDASKDSKNSKSDNEKVFINLEETLNDSRQTSQKIKSMEENISALQKKISSFQEEMDEIEEEWEVVQEFQGEDEEEQKKIHLLFLNASIESARLSEQGKGIEVVAQELKSMEDRLENSQEKSEYSFEQIQKNISHLLEIYEESSAILKEIQSASQNLSHSLDSMREQGRIFLEKNLMILTQNGHQSSRSLERMFQDMQSCLKEGEEIFRL